MHKRKSLADVKEHIFNNSMPIPESGCWIWMGSLTTDGYGSLGIGCLTPNSQRAHRTSYTLYVGPINPGLEVRHKCHIRSCVNPDHLCLGTHAENMKDTYDKNRVVKPEIVKKKRRVRSQFLKTHCIKGHPYTEENTYRDLKSNRQCRECRARKKQEYLERRRNLKREH